MRTPKNKKNTEATKANPEITPESNVGIAPEASTTTSSKEDLKRKIEEAKAKRDAAKAELEQAKAKEKEESKAKREKEASEKKALKEAEKEEKKNRVPVMVTQKDEKGNEEQVDSNLFPVVIVCADCGEIRYVTKSQAHEVVRCKPCAKQYKRRKTAAKRKERVKGYKEVVEAAMLLNLFPDDFKAKWGLK